MAEGETLTAAASPVLVAVIMTVMNSPSETTAGKDAIAEARTVALCMVIGGLISCGDETGPDVLISVPAALTV
jgi:hypothetical protein